MEWRVAAHADNAFREAARRQPGWYWVLRPKNLGRHSYDAEAGVMCLVRVDAEGELLSPLADLRRLEHGDLTCLDAATGVRLGTFFAGPVAPGEVSGAVRARVVDDAVAAQFTGESPAVPGWAWCRTNAEAPLLLVDEEGVGPVYLEADADGVVRVFLASDTHGHSVDVGEFGFSEPLVSRGGVIDESGELGRTEAEFHGAVTLPPPPPASFPVLR
ncbi:MAG: hypothetical protein H6732_07275 [Alphaproteobacteria bacterium]|nr:hypothetical protein [Alphaproteobacteria bacterium]